MSSVPTSSVPTPAESPTEVPASVSRKSIVYVHIGLPKTGTTYLQDRLWRNRDIALRVAGLLYPGNAIDDHFHAAVHLQPERYLDWVDPAQARVWPTMTAQMRAWRGPSLISHELFASATEEQVRRLCADLSFADEIRVIATVRDLGRQLPSVWQENVKNQRRASLTEFVAAVAAHATDPEREVGEEGPFWEFQDYVAILARWADVVGAANVHVVTVPARGASGGDTLWARFVRTLGADPAQLTATVPTSNSSLSAAQTEFLRALNERLQPGTVDWQRYERIVKGRLIGEVLFESPGGTSARVPEEWQLWVAQRSQEMVAALDRAGYRIVGSLDELRVEPEAAGATTPPPTTADVLDVALDTLAQLVLSAPMPRTRPRWETKARNLVRRAQRRAIAVLRR